MEQQQPEQRPGFEITKHELETNLDFIHRLHQEWHAYCKQAADYDLPAQVNVYGQIVYLENCEDIAHTIVAIESVERIAESTYQRFRNDAPSETIPSPKFSPGVTVLLAARAAVHNAKSVIVARIPQIAAGNAMALNLRFLFKFNENELEFNPFVARADERVAASWVWAEDQRIANATKSSETDTPVQRGYGWDEDDQSRITRLEREMWIGMTGSATGPVTYVELLQWLQDYLKYATKPTAVCNLELLTTSLGRFGIVMGAYQGVLKEDPSIDSDLQIYVHMLFGELLLEIHHRQRPSPVMCPMPGVLLEILEERRRSGRPPVQDKFGVYDFPLSDYQPKQEE